MVKFYIRLLQNLYRKGKNGAEIGLKTLRILEQLYADSSNLGEF